MIMNYAKLEIFGDYAILNYIVHCFAMMGHPARVCVDNYDVAEYKWQTVTVAVCVSDTWKVITRDNIHLVLSLAREKCPSVRLPNNEETLDPDLLERLKQL